MQPRLFQWLCCCALAVILCCPARVAAGSPPPDTDEAALRQVGIRTDPASLKAYLARLAPAGVNPDDLSALIHRLGSKAFKARSEAARTLVTVGAVGIPALRQAERDPDPEIRTRARACLKSVLSHCGAGEPLSAVRCLLAARPAGTVEALMRYLPFADPEEARVEVCYGVDELAAKDREVGRALMPYLADACASRRALAGCVVGARSDQTQRAAVRTLLKDPAAEVRLRAAQGLLATGDKAAVPCLIDLLAEQPTLVAWQAEELLRWCAGKRAPAPLVGAGARRARRRCRAAWQDWWAEHGAAFPMGRGHPSGDRPQLLLVCEYRAPELHVFEGRVWLCGHDGKTRWELPGFAVPIDAQLLPDETVLVADWHTNEVVRRELDGRLVWKRPGPPHKGMRRCQVLPSGEFFIGATYWAMFLTPAGKVRQEYDLRATGATSWDLLLLPNNHFLGLGQRGRQGVIAEIDPEVKEFAINVSVWEIPLKERLNPSFQIETVWPGRYLVAVLSQPARLQHNVCTPRLIGSTGKPIRQWPGVSLGRATLFRGCELLASGEFDLAQESCAIMRFDAAGKLAWLVRGGGGVECSHPVAPLLGLGFRRRP